MPTFPLQKALGSTFRCSDPMNLYRLLLVTTVRDCLTKMLGVCSNASFDQTLRALVQAVALVWVSRLCQRLLLRLTERSVLKHRSVTARRSLFRFRVCVSNASK